MNQAIATWDLIYNVILRWAPKFHSDISVIIVMGSKDSVREIPNTAAFCNHLDVLLLSIDFYYKKTVANELAIHSFSS